MGSIHDILKPKSSEEIEDLERRGFRKDMGKWKFCINFSNILLEYDSTKDISLVNKNIVSLLKDKINDIKLYAGDVESKNFEDIIVKFENLKEPSPGELDSIMELLYIWANDNNVWINPF